MKDLNITTYLKRYEVIAGSLVLCIILNLIKSNPLLISLLNSLFLILSICFYSIFSNKKLAILNPLIILLAFVPLFTTNYLPIVLVVSLISLIVFIFLVLMPKGKLVGILGIGIIFLAALVAGNLIDRSFHLDSGKKLI